MKIAYLAFIRLPTEKAHGAQIMKTCEAFADEGAEVELVIPGRSTPIHDDPFAYYDVRKNFNITALATPDWVEKVGAFGFTLSMLWFSEAAKWRKSFWEANIIYSRDAGVLLQYHLLGLTLVYEAHTKPTRISTFVAKRAHRLIVISEGLRDAYIERGVPKEKITVAHDAIDPEPFKVPYDQKTERERLDIPFDKKVALYVGRIDAAKGADTFAAASTHIPSEWLCVLIGSGPLKDELMKKYPEALFLSETPYRDLPRTLTTADVLALPNSAKDEDVARYTSPLKAFAYMAAGKPIVASDVPALRAILKEAAFFTPDDPRSLATVVQDTQTKPVIFQEKLYSWRSRSQTILSALS